MGIVSKKREKIGRAIITFARGWQTLVATRSLGRRGIEVITADEYGLTTAAFSRYSVANFRYPNPSKNPEQFLDTLEEKILEYKPEADDMPYVLIPIHKETYLIAQQRERFEPYISIPVPDIKAIELVHNKGTLAAYAQERGLPTPKTWIPNSMEEFKTQLDSIVLPAFVKLRESAAGVGIQKVNTLKELETCFLDFVNHFKLSQGEYPLIQQGVPGDDYCVTVLFNRGSLQTCMTYHNLRAFPAEKGAGVLRETVSAPHLERIASELLTPLGWHGVAELDFRWDGTPQGQPYLIEVNPRFWGGLIQAVESGWDYPWLLFQLAAHGTVKHVQSGRYDVRTETPILGFLATIQDIAKNDRSMDKLTQAWQEAKKEFRDESKRTTLKNFIQESKGFFDLKSRLSAAKQMLDVHKNNVFDVLSGRDPLAVPGILYPIAVLLKHGKVNMELLTGETGPSSEDE